MWNSLRTSNKNPEDVEYFNLVRAKIIGRKKKNLKAICK